MSKVKKLLLGIAVMAIAIFGCTNIAKAASYTVGQSVSMTYAKYISDGDLFCVEHNQALKGTLTYKVISQVDIRGNVSTDHTGKSIESWHNAKLAYILSADNGPVKQSGPVQNAIWNYMYTWMKNVGQYHAGLYDGFASTTTGSGSSLDGSSSDYASELENLEVTDNTNKQLIRVQTEGNYMRIGPFNWSFSGTLSEIQVKDQDGNPISGIMFSNYTGTTSNTINVSDIQSGKDFYVLVPTNTGVTRITGLTAKGSVDVKGVTIWFLEPQNGYKYQNLIARQPYTTPYEYEQSFDYDIPLLGNLKVIKVDADNHERKLQGVGFVIQNKETGLYVHQDTNGNITYVERDQATEFVTDENGEILIENLVVGTYVAYETQNPNEGYEIVSENQEHTVVVDKTDDFIIENKRVYVKLSGYVWLDKQSGKQSVRNDLYNDDENDDADELLEGVIVRLMDRTTGEVARNDNGEEYTAITKEIQVGDNIIRYYQFTDVRVENLENYYVEFEYDGLTYTNVTPHITEDNGSKAAENANVRDEFNRSFSSIEGTSETTGVARDEAGNITHELSYEKDREQHRSTFINEGLPVGQYPITANTDETGYSIAEQFEPGMEEIPYINLGLYEREQPDLALVKDMQNVRIAINGYQHIYEYAQRFNNQEEYSGDGFNVGVKFASKYLSNSYTRAIYKADYEYVNENDSSRELQVYITYRIAIRNETTNLTMQASRIADYFDSRYTIVSAGTGIDQEGIITGNLEFSQEAYNDDYTKATIYTDTRLEPQSQLEIYVQFQLNREAVINILNSQENLVNVAEIDQYSTFDGNGNIYAGIDVDSNPGNAIPGDVSSYEDDTDASPSLILEVADAREMTGKVFLDSTTGELMTGEIRQGSGAYEEGETGIPGVQVTLTETSGTGLVYTATTDENGDFYISDFIPGQYTLTYTWGDSTYTVQDYKGTVYDKDRYDTNMQNPQWYKTDVDTRWTDAVDDYETRLEIDQELTEITNSTETTIDKMDSTTPPMEFGVEYETTYTASAGDRYTYRVENIDFGIVERARQDLTLIKQVRTMKVTLANGQTLVDVQVTDDGQLEGQTSGVIYLPASPNTTPSNGLLRLEMDSEIMEGARLEVGYAIKVQNNSELEYLSENYYKYGIIEGNPVTITPNAIVDYLDSDWSFDANANPDWEAIQKDDPRIDLADEVMNSTSIDNTTMLYTEALSGYALRPTESAEVILTVSKLLTTSGDIELDNEAEIVELEKTGGPTPTSTPGNYVPGTGPNVEGDDGMGETVIVTPNTGENMNYIIPTICIVTACIIIGVGIVFIKKKVLKK